MNIIKKENRVYFNDKDIAFGNISIHETFIKIEMIRIIPQFRGKGLSRKFFTSILQYIQQNLTCKKILLSPMPINNGGEEQRLEFEELVNFYKKFNFKISEEKSQEEPYLMVKYL